MHTPTPCLGWSVRIALYTAMRQGEILSLTLDQIDLQRRVVRLNETKTAVPGLYRYQSALLRYFIRLLSIR